MAKLLLIVLVLTAWKDSTFARQIDELKFSTDKLEKFAFDWFQAVNQPNKEILNQYIDPEWNDYLDVLISHTQMKEGIIPYLVSYKTDNFISIYSKENNGGWVKVNLGLTKDDRIGLMGIKKSVFPVDYDLREQISEKQKREIAEDLSRILADKYVISEHGQSYSKKLINKLNQGSFEGINQGDWFAEELTKELKEISNDKHLQVIPPSRINEVVMRFGDEEASENTEGSLNPADIIDAKVLDQKYGLITIERFVDSKEVKLDTKKEFEKIKQTKGIIIDLRNSGGGDGKAVEDLLSYFFKSENPLSDYFSEKPIAVLTSSKTISAGEALSYEIKQKKRGIIVGQKTAGAGFLVNVFELVYGFYAVISTNTNFDIEKKEGWQGIGIIPDLEASSGKALEKAIETLSKRS